MISEEKINEIIDRIVKNYHPEKIILFGSHAEGNPTEESDLDLLIVKETDVPRYKRGREVRKHLRGLKVPIDLIVYTKSEIRKWSDVKTSFINTVMEKGKVLYGQDQPTD